MTLALRALRLVAAFALLAGVGPAAQAARETDIPFRVPGPDAPYILMDAQLGGRGPFTLLLDTGNATPFVVALSPDAVRRAGGRPGRGAPFISYGAVGGPVRMDRWTLPQLSLGSVTLTDISAGVTDAVDRVRRGLGIRIDGIVGHEFLASHVVAIDYACRRVDFDATPPREPPATTFTFAPRRPLLLVSARVNGRGPWLLALDTGSGNTIISPELARAAGVTTNGRTELAGAGGVERDGRTGRADVSLGGMTPRRINIVVSGLIGQTARVAGAPIGGIAGTQMFADGRLVIDYPGRRLWLLPPGPCRQPQ